jgi:cyclohexanecarboxyl-CoA dehydrogenase
MDFTIDSSIAEMASVTRRFCRERIDPVADRWDHGEVIDRAIFRQMGDLGLLSMRLPAEHGGQNISFVDCGTIVNEVGRGDIGLALMVVNAVMFGELTPLMSETVKETWTPRIASGSPFAFTLTEPGAGSDAAGIRTTAARDGDEYVINGEKTTVTYCGLADVAIVFARTGGPGARGISAFMTPWDAPGIEKQVYDSVGERVTKRGQVFYDDLRVPADNLVGSVGGGFVEAMKFFDYNRAFLALACLGAAERSIEEIIEFVKERKTFGRPLASNQGVTFQIAEHLTRIEAAKLLAYKVLWLRDQGLRHSKEAAMIKWFGIQEAYQALHTCLILSGWPGYSSDLPHDRRMRDVMGLELGDGTPEIMKMVVAREAIGRVALGREPQEETRKLASVPA